MNTLKGKVEEAVKSAKVIKSELKPKLKQYLRHLFNLTSDEQFKSAKKEYINFVKILDEFNIEINELPVAGSGKAMLEFYKKASLNNNKEKSLFITAKNLRLYDMIKKIEAKMPKSNKDDANASAAKAKTAAEKAKADAANIIAIADLIKKYSSNIDKIANEIKDAITADQKIKKITDDFKFSDGSGFDDVKTTFDTAVQEVSNTTTAVALAAAVNEAEAAASDAADAADAAAKADDTTTAAAAATAAVDEATRAEIRANEINGQLAIFEKNEKTLLKISNELNTLKGKVEEAVKSAKVIKSELKPKLKQYLRHLFNLTSDEQFKSAKKEYINFVKILDEFNIEINELPVAGSGKAMLEYYKKASLNNNKEKSLIITAKNLRLYDMIKKIEAKMPKDPLTVVDEKKIKDFIKEANTKASTVKNSYDKASQIFKDISLSKEEVAKKARTLPKPLDPNPETKITKDLADIDTKLKDVSADLKNIEGKILKDSNKITSKTEKDRTDIDSAEKIKGDATISSNTVQTKIDTIIILLNEAKDSIDKYKKDVEGELKSQVIKSVKKIAQGQTLDFYTDRLSLLETDTGRYIVPNLKILEIIKAVIVNDKIDIIKKGSGMRNDIPIDETIILTKALITLYKSGDIIGYRNFMMNNKDLIDDWKKYVMKSMYSTAIMREIFGPTKAAGTDSEFPTSTESIAKFKKKYKKLELETITNNMKGLLYYIVIYLYKTNNQTDVTKAVGLYKTTVERYNLNQGEYDSWEQKKPGPSGIGEDFSQYAIPSDDSAEFSGIISKKDRDKDIQKLKCKIKILEDQKKIHYYLDATEKLKVIQGIDRSIEIIAGLIKNLEDE